MSQKVMFMFLFILALALPACGVQDDGEPAPSETAVPTNPPASTVAPTATAVPAPEIPLGDEYRSQEGGYAFLTIPKYGVEEFSGFVTMMGADSDPNLGPAIGFIGGLNKESGTLEQLFEEFQQEMIGEEDVQLANERETTVGEAPGLAADLSGNFEGDAVNGRIVVALVTPTQPFTMFGAAPAESWEEFALLFDAVLASVSFFSPVTWVVPPTMEPPPVVEAPEPETAVTEIRQWASYAWASSEYSDPDWAAVQATGKPDTLVNECADLPTAWASYDSDTAEWIELTYDTPVIPTQINIIQTHSPDQVVKVELADMTGAYHEIYTGEPENLWAECPYTLSIPVDVKYEVAGLRVSIDQSIIPTTWNEIDAVELVGVAEQNTVDLPTKINAETPAADGELLIEGLRGYEDTYGALQVAGLLTNHSANAVNNVVVEIEIRDAAGTSLHTDTAWMFLYELPAGATTPFLLTVNDDLTGVDSFAANIISHRATEIDRAVIEVRGMVRTIDDDGNVHVTGEIVNNGSEPAAINGVAAAAFDGSGETVAVGSSILQIGYLEPGDSGPFRVFMYGPSERVDTIVDHAVYIGAVTTSPETDWLVTFSEESRTYQDRYDDVHLVGEVTNASDENLNMRLLASFYDADGNVLDADTFSLPLDLAPGDTLPFDIVGGWASLEHTTGLFGKVDSYIISLDSHWTWTSSEVTVDLTTADDAQEFRNDAASFTGHIVNSSGTAVDKAIIIVGLRDAVTGELVATGYDSIFDDIPADGTAYYWIEIDLEPGFDESGLEVFFIVKGEQS